MVLWNATMPQPIWGYITCVLCFDYSFNKLTWNIQHCIPCVLFYFIKPGLEPNSTIISDHHQPGTQLRRSQTVEEALPKAHWITSQTSNIPQSIITKLVAAVGFQRPQHPAQKTTNKTNREENLGGITTPSTTSPSTLLDYSQLKTQHRLDILEAQGR